MARSRASSMSIRRTVLPCSRSVRQRSRISPSEKTALPAPMIAIVGVTFPPSALTCQTAADAFSTGHRCCSASATAFPRGYLTAPSTSPRRMKRCRMM